MSNESAVERAGDTTQPSPPRWLRPARDWVRAKPAGPTIWKVFIAVLGGIIVAGGLALVPLPGPGWVIVFGGLAIWATEFVWAQRLLRWARGILTQWTDWAKRQPRWIQALVGLAGLIVLVAVAYAAYRLLG